jgi:hypothetical protein
MHIVPACAHFLAVEDNITTSIAEDSIATSGGVKVSHWTSPCESHFGRMKQLTKECTFEKLVARSASSDNYDCARSIGKQGGGRGRAAEARQAEFARSGVKRLSLQAKMVLGVQVTERNYGYVLDILAELEAAASETAFFLAPHPCKGRRRLVLGVDQGGG